MAEMGRLAVWVALLAGGAAVVSRRRLALTVAVGAALVATLVLVRALVTDDYSLVYVADFSRRDASTPFRVAALWGGMAGSLLWFATLAGLVGWWAAGRVRSVSSSTGPAPADSSSAGSASAGPAPAGSSSAGLAPAAGIVSAVTGGLVAALAGLVLAFADPFRRLAVPAIDGGGLTPILEHQAMLYHPPLLYLGLASLTGPFALTVAGLLGHGGDGWTVQVRRWLVVPWTLLAAGMLAGAHWAYVELGWGGYWAWDPVENTALLPWLAVTLALHAGVAGPARRRVLPQAALVCTAFLLALTGTMLARSGAVSSVHAFAESRAIGRALGALVVAATASVAVLLVRSWRSTRPVPVPAARGVVPQLVAGHFLIVGTVLGVATIGTVAPLVTDLRGGDGIAIEGRYFASFAGPLATAGLALVALVPLALRLAELARSPVAAAPAPAMADDAGDTPSVGLRRDAGGRRVAGRSALSDGTAEDDVRHEAGVALAVAAGGPPPVLTDRGRPIGRDDGVVPAVAGAVAVAGGPTVRRGGVASDVPAGRWTLRTVRREAVVVLAGAVLGSGALHLAGGDAGLGVGVLGAAAGTALVTAAAGGLRAVRRGERVVGHVAHAGLGLLLLGVAGTASGATETLTVEPGDRVTVLGETVEYRGVEVVEDVANGGGRVAGSSAVVADVHTAGHDLRPSLVAYPAIARVLAETSLVSTPGRDVQVGLRDADDSGAGVLQVGVYPLQVLVWWGGLVLVLAGALAGVSGSRRRPAGRHP